MTLQHVCSLHAGLHSSCYNIVSILYSFSTVFPLTSVKTYIKTNRGERRKLKQLRLMAVLSQLNANPSYHQGRPFGGFKRMSGSGEDGRGKEISEKSFCKEKVDSFFPLFIGRGGQINHRFPSQKKILLFYYIWNYSNFFQVPSSPIFLASLTDSGLYIFSSYLSIKIVLPTANWQPSITLPKNMALYGIYWGTWLLILYQIWLMIGPNFYLKTLDFKNS